MEDLLRKTGLLCGGGPLDAPSRLYVIDVETTGGATTDDVVEIGCLEISLAKQGSPSLSTRRFSYICKPAVEVGPYALAAHGMTTEYLMKAAKYTTGEVLLLLVDFMQGGSGVHESSKWFTAAKEGSRGVASNAMSFVVCGHNIQFDVRFLCAAAERYNVPELTRILGDSPTLCTMAMFSAMYPSLRKKSLAFACEFFGINRNPSAEERMLVIGDLRAKDSSSHHSALTDTFVTAELLLRMLPLVHLTNRGD